MSIFQFGPGVGAVVAGAGVGGLDMVALVTLAPANTYTDYGEGAQSSNLIRALYELASLCYMVRIMDAAAFLLMFYI